MQSPTVELEFELPGLPLFRKYTDGRFERLHGLEFVPPSDLDPTTGVSSKDVVIDPDTGVTARLYLPIGASSHLMNGSTTYVSSGTRKLLPVLLYFHGGGFCVENPFSPFYHPYVNALAYKTQALVVSVNYRLAPEHLLPAAYDDSWAALKWVLSHKAVGGKGTEQWLNRHADMSRVFLVGDSAGGNIVHHLAIRVAEEEGTPGRGSSAASSPELLKGIVLVHPYFWGSRRLPEEAEKFEPKFLAMIDSLWPIASGKDSVDDPWLNVTADDAPNFTRLGCRRVLVMVAGLDFLRARGLHYYEKLAQSNWEGVAELWETAGEGHVFHILDRTAPQSEEMMDRLVSFINAADG